MNFRAAATALGMSFVAMTSGCGESNEGYVDFEKTAPVPLDQQPGMSEAGREATGQSPTNQSPTVPLHPEVRPVSAVSETDSPGVTHAVSAAGSASAGGADRPVAGTAPAVDQKNGTTGADAASPEATIQPSVPSVGSEAATISTDEPAAADTSIEAAPGQVVSPQSGLVGPADNPLIENAASSEPRKIELLIPEKVFRKERGSNSVRVSYDDLDLLKILNMEPVPANAADYFPEWLKALDGQSIRIRGFMYPTFEATGLTEFTLARDNGICCFVRQPKIYDIIAIQLAEGVTSDYIEGRPFDVEGLLRIEPLADENDLSRLYRIEEARVLR